MDTSELMPNFFNLSYFIILQTAHLWIFY